MILSGELLLFAKVQIAEIDKVIISIVKKPNKKPDTGVTVVVMILGR